MMPLTLLVLGWSYRFHRQPLALGLGLIATMLAYLHVFAGTPEWTQWSVAAIGVAAAVVDWRSARSCPIPVRPAPARVEGAPRRP